MTHTFNSVSELLQDRWESDLPDRVLEALKPCAGKNITTRILDKLPGGKDQWRLRREYGMTHIENNDYWRSGGNSRNGISLLVDWRTDSFPLDLAALEKNNACYFSARKSRNHCRMEARNDKPLLDKMAATLNRVEAALRELEKAKAEFEAMTEFESPFFADRFELETACGLRVEKK